MMTVLLLVCIPIGGLIIGKIVGYYNIAVFVVGIPVGIVIYFAVGLFHGFAIQPILDSREETRRRLRREQVSTRAASLNQDHPALSEVAATRLSEELSDEEIRARLEPLSPGDVEVLSRLLDGFPAKGALLIFSHLTKMQFSHDVALKVASGELGPEMTRQQASFALYRRGYPSEIVEAILNGEVIEGMTPEQVTLTLGERDEEQRKVLATKTKLVWTYLDPESNRRKIRARVTFESVGNALSVVAVDQEV